jgi:hypothetical protein
MAKRHGGCGTRLYRIWCHMKSRCYCETDKKFHRYGMRGITVCNEWKESFAAFRSWAELSGYQDDLTIDRIDNDGNYCPENCQWSNLVEQNRNRSTTLLTKATVESIKEFLSDGKKLKEAAEKYGISIYHAWNIKSGRKWK